MSLRYVGIREKLNYIYMYGHYATDTLIMLHNQNLELQYII